MTRGRMGCLWMILKPVVLLGVILVVIGVVAYPWAVPLPGRDALTGPWGGDVRSSEGPRARLYLNLRIAPGYRLQLLRGRNRLGGDAVLCTGRRRIELSIIGYTTAWSGKAVDLLLKPARPSPPELRFDVLGTWDGHTLELKDSSRSLAEALNEPATPLGELRGAHWIAASLRRGTKVAFDSACATFGGRS
jgi:hypothetical protein